MLICVMHATISTEHAPTPKVPIGPVLSRVQEAVAKHQRSTGTAVVAVLGKRASRRAEAAGRGASIRTVVVDASPANLKAFSSLLEQQSEIELVGSATDGYHAVRRVRELEPDLVLTALRVDGMIGLELTRQVKALAQAPTVIIVAADDTEEYRAAARAAGADGFVSRQDMTLLLPAFIRALLSSATG
jgi:CheY-like chemotaxis protein